LYGNVRTVIIRGDAGRGTVCHTAVQ